MALVVLVALLLLATIAIRIVTWRNLSTTQAVTTRAASVLVTPTSLLGKSVSSKTWLIK